MLWRPLRELAPDVNVQQVGANGNGGSSGTVMCLALLDPDGETHIYPCNEDGRRKLVELLTGGIVVTPGVPR